MRAIEFIFESYPLAKKEFSQVAKPDVVQTTIDQYRELVRKNQFRNPEEKNINHWRRLGWEAFSQMVKVKSNDITDTQRKRGKVSGNAIILQDDAEWVVLIPLDKEASVHYGKDTEWCTTKPYQSFYEKYVYERNITLIYAIDKTRSGRSVAISIEPKRYTRMFNQRDNSIDPTTYTEISGLDPDKFIQMAKLPENQQQLTASIEKYKVAKAKTAKLLAASPLDPEAIERELKITKNSEDCYNYIVKYGQEQNRRIAFHPIILTAAASSISNMFFSAEENAIELGQYIDFSNITMSVFKSILRTSPSLFTYNFKLLSNEQQQAFSMSAASAYEYADKILGKKPFPAGEAAIATSAECSYKYASKILNKPFPAGEPAIATSAEYSYVYARQFFNGVGWPLGEAIIAKNGASSHHYATRVTNKPFPLGEPAIFKDKQYWKKYVVELLKNHQSPSWERLIKNDAEKSYEYAKARKQLFPAGEPAIATSAKYSCLYAINVLKLKAFPLGEPAIMTDDQYAQQYAQTVLTRYPSLSWEKLIKDNPARSYEYAAAHRLRFRGGEAAIATDPHYARLYDQMLGTNLSQQ